MQAREILETCLCVADLDAARDFYTRVLGLVLYSEQPGRHVFFRCGQRMFLLFDAAASSQTDGLFPPHGTQGQGHVAFAATEDQLDAWVAHLAAEDVPLELDYHWPQGGRSLYFRDPSGNCLEIASPRIWQLDDARTCGDAG